ncbi:MAG: OmpA family protein [Myxococcales bacterium]|nr:OmpA family protein [Myxococcales bacterium]
MSKRTPSGRRPLRPLAAVLAVTSLAPLAACAPTVFADNSAMTIIGDPPPPPPKPEVVEKPKRVEVTDDAVVINEKIEFEQDKAVIREVSFDLLREVAETILEHKHIKKVSIEGHASSEGDDNYNMKLSDRRAKAVMQHLIEKGGVPKEMLVAKGFGETRPIASNDTEEGREDNRRVEFIIIEQDVTQKKVEVDPETGEQKVIETQTKTVTK